MVHLSVAVGRFFEALLYAIFGIALHAALVVLAGAALVIGAFVLARRVWNRDKRRP